MIPKENYIGFRTDLEDYFQWMTGVPVLKKSFTPFIYKRGNYFCARWFWRKLLAIYQIPEETIIMQIWPGHYSCDCFIFTLPELKDYLTTNKIKI